MPSNFTISYSFSLLSLLSIVLCHKPAIAQQLPPLPINEEGYSTNRENPAPPNYIDYQAPSTIIQNNQIQNNQNFERYLVYVDSNNPQELQQIRSIEPRAFYRQVQGRSIIQVGVFSKQPNALERVRELQSYGINSVRILSLNNGQEIPSSGNPNIENSRNQKYYYVAIPASPGELPDIENRIRGNIRQNIGVMARNQPRGSHVAVGPFVQRSQAEQWNNYLLNLGFGNARVYYGR
ncbi:MAG: SPOR domain-containing protein [Cyanomargarita calcarea GSE-NOS-MK-12-04C]|jgi:hypothetical protein|uniref:SPOR domain-containing protein n=1 Tax=Cyanomargarita calcarea GSE-NOS-MK-12-04C TaxID=2839659 RepID=A0A951QN43_9CYAN|nr:SPOR domain-containing protein [Cyanomargarita calcarea GSE-NOS-MK-12-04C]